MRWVWNTMEGGWKCKGPGLNWLVPFWAESTCLWAELCLNWDSGPATHPLPFLPVFPPPQTILNLGKEAQAGEVLQSISMGYTLFPVSSWGTLQAPSGPNYALHASFPAQDHVTCSLEYVICNQRGGLNRVSPVPLSCLLLSVSFYCPLIFLLQYKLCCCWSTGKEAEQASRIRGRQWAAEAQFIFWTSSSVLAHQGCELRITGIASFCSMEFESRKWNDSILFGVEFRSWHGFHNSLLSLWHLLKDDSNIRMWDSSF